MKFDSPEAAFDALYIVIEMADSYPSITQEELQLFIYLACILGLYNGHPIADWKYSFVATPSTAPFSADLLGAVQRLERAQCIEEHDGLLMATAKGREELDRWLRLQRFMERVPYLRGAAGATKVMPMAFVRSGIELEPQLHNAVALRGSRHLLDDVGVAQVYAQFRVLATALGDRVSDYMVPAVVWLSFLLEEDSAPEVDH